MATYRQLRGAIAIDVGLLAAPKSLSLIIFIIIHRTQSIFGAAAVLTGAWGRHDKASEWRAKLLKEAAIGQPVAR